MSLDIAVVSQVNQHELSHSVVMVQVQDDNCAATVDKMTDCLN
jgi:hypothetical protein